MQEEIWREVRGYDYPYAVSNKGRFKYCESERAKKNGLVYRYGERIVESRECGKRYKKVGVTKSGRYFHKYIHQLVAEHFPEICGEWFEGAEVDHIIPIELGGTDNAENLHWVTHGDNMQNPLSKQLHSISGKGRKHSEESKRKMSEAQKKPIKVTRLDGTVERYCSVKEAAKMNGVSTTWIIYRLHGIVKSEKNKWEYE